MTAFFEQPGSRWFNIPAHRPFAEDLAQGLFDALSPPSTASNRPASPRCSSSEIVNSNGLLLTTAHATPRVASASTAARAPG